jgi:hypothetical protein
VLKLRVTKIALRSYSNGQPMDLAPKDELLTERISMSRKTGQEELFAFTAITQSSKVSPSGSGRAVQSSRDRLDVRCSIMQLSHTSSSKSTKEEYHVP